MARMIFAALGAFAAGVATGGALLSAAQRRMVAAPELGPTAPGRAKPVAVVWAGPVSLSQVEGAWLEALPVAAVTCKGDGKPSCAQRADGWKDAEGRRLPGLRRTLKLGDGPLILAAFSAGGHLVHRVLQHPKDRAEVAGVVLADATYVTTWEDKAARRATPIASLVEYAREAIADGRLFIATASSTPNSGSSGKVTNYPTGAETLAAIATAAGLEERAKGGEPWPGGLAPGREWGNGASVRLADCGGALMHAEHATKLAPKVWGAWVKPFFGGSIA